MLGKDGIRILAEQLVRVRADSHERQVHPGATFYSVSPLRHVDMNEPIICERHVFPLRTRKAGRVYACGVVPETNTGIDVDLHKRGSRFQAGIGEQLKPNHLWIVSIVLLGQLSNTRQNQFGRHALCTVSRNENPNDIVQGKIALGRRHFQFALIDQRKAPLVTLCHQALQSDAARFTINQCFLTLASDIRIL